MTYEIRIGDEFVATDDPSRLDLDWISAQIEQTYWGKGRPRDLFERAIRHSLCLGLYHQDGDQVGFARIVTDYALRAHLNDVLISATLRGRGLGRAFVQAVLSHPELSTVGTWTLMTRDRHAFYGYFGFGPLEKTSEQLILKRSG